MPNHRSKDTPSKIEALEDSLAQCQTVFNEPNKLSKQKKADLKILEDEFVSTATELCEKLSDAHENQTIDDKVTDDILNRAHDITHHISDKTPIPRKKIEKIIALNDANTQLQTQTSPKNTTTQALIELLTKMALLATVVLTFISPGPGAVLGLSVDISVALLSFLPHAFDTCKRLFSDKPEPLNLDNAKELQQVYKETNKIQRKEQEPNPSDEAKPEQEQGPSLV
ncbi:MAG: hypothetical protein GW760_06700 [Legionella sp.]|jgi:hypothetical protein|nr:hypothetical protein [Legionella sp.]